MKFFRYLVGLAGGVLFGFLYAPKKGHELRKEILVKSKHGNAEGAKVFLKAFQGAGKAMVVDAKDLGKSEEIQEFLHYGEEKIKDILVKAQDHGIEFAAMAQEKLEQLASFASTKAKELEMIAQKEVSKEGSKIAKKMQRKASGFKRRFIKK